jgi:beta-lactam-binding protein with PASTA domain/predicted Ser/Thr protein kinase
MSERVDPGTIIDGRYKILRRLGSGGMAEVYCAEDLQLGRNVALKLLYRRFAEDREFVERFRREASSAAGLQHQHVVSVYDRGEWDGTYYIAMEFLDGRSLKQVVQEEAPMAPGRAIDLAVQILRAARFAHRRGIIHRDLKPHNVIVDADGRAKVTDFGIARAGASDMTQTGSIMGTAQYLSPEQAQGHAVSAASDLYAVGIVLYEMLTGRVPFDGESAVTIALKQVSDAPVPPSAFNGAVTPELEAVVLRALEKDPEARFPDAETFISALESVRASLPADAPAIPVAAAAGATQHTTPLEPVAALQPTGPFAPSIREEEHAYYPAEPLPPPPEGGGSRWWAWLLALLLVAGLVVGGVLLLTGKKVQVPNVVGADQASAQLALKRAGFSSDPVPKTSADRPAGTVIGQDPPGGEKAKKGSTVTLFVSSGPGRATIPVLKGVGKRKATKQLTRLGFKVDQQPQSDDTIPKDHVIDTSPTAGNQLDKGNTVILYVSTGPQLVAVPDVVNAMSDKARATLEDAGFTVHVEHQESDKPVGTVLAQDPAAGAQRPKGSSVTITVAKAPAQVDVPDVTGQTEDDAVSMLSDAGFGVQIHHQAVTDPTQDGVVISQDPAGGSKAKKGTKVAIVVGSFTAGTTPGTTTGPTGP